MIGDEGEMSWAEGVGKCGWVLGLGSISVWWAVMG